MATIQPPQGQTQSTNPSGTALSGSYYSGPVGNSFDQIPGLGGLLSSLYGSKPATTNPVASAAQAIQGNRQNLPADTALTLGTDTTSAVGASLPFQINLPDYESMLTTATGNASQELEGKVPQDVQNLLQTEAAERGVASGQGFDSPNTNAAYLQALGLTSLGQERQGQQDLSTLIGETPTGVQFNPSSMFVTPAEQQAANQNANQVAAAADPVASGLMSTFMSFI